MIIIFFQFNYQDFTNTWQQTVPSTMKTMDYQLEVYMLIFDYLK